ncbi:MAG: hypothetical protein COA70_08060 [Planctomycetota bacterium]|nr:MAG: hypothetical protein COA70_08060 [Planctomycetota bacterium]
MPVFFYAPEALLGAEAPRRLESPGSVLLPLGRSYGYAAAHRALIQTIPTRRCTPRTGQRFLRPCTFGSGTDQLAKPHGSALLPLAFA